MNLTPAFSQETAATLGKYRSNFGHNRERDFFRCFTADVESGWREQGSDLRVEIERSIFAEPRQQLGMALSWPEQSNVTELERLKTIEREKIATEIMSHDDRGGLRVRAKTFGQF